MSKFIFVTGGVVSSLGKGITAASLGCLLKSRGYRVSIQKLDPYINFNPGNMSPFQHGEIFVTEDGAETDLDLGHYERFINENLSEKNNYTAGKIYWSVITRERKGDFQGGTVQVIPHVTNEIKNKIQEVACDHDLDVVIVEVGGTVGDIESLPFLEAIRQMKTDIGKENVLYLHVTLVPYLPSTEELKTKPTQHSVKELRSIGIQPDVIVCRSDLELSKDIKEKIALFCDIKPREVVVNFNALNIYEVPLLLQKEGLDSIVIDKMQLNGYGEDQGKVQLERWKAAVEKNKNLSREINLALVGKYVSLKDAYLSVTEALNHSGALHDCKIIIKWVEDDKLEREGAEQVLQGVDGVIIPGGMGEGEHGLEAKIKAINWCRLQGVPFLGINSGMHGAIIELARHKCGWEKAHSSEADPVTPFPVIDAVGQEETFKKESTILGALACQVIKGTLAYGAYRQERIRERCRHNHIFQDDRLRAFMEEKGVIFSGLSCKEGFPCILELKDHPWFLAVQFHPEFKSRPLSPHPLISSFIKSTLKRIE